MKHQVWPRCADRWTYFVGTSAFFGVLLLGMPALRATGQGVRTKTSDRHDPANAVANLDVYPGLQATLFASEPTLTNPTNIDIDVRGRVWVCDVMNYRGHDGSRPAGDRILILEDTKGTGTMDRAKVFYQGRDIDSAMGICVLGNKVIVSSSPSVFVFTFDGNDKILKKEVLFSKTGRSQHDHTAHTFVFGPDGKLYWNFGNEGHSVHDKNGKPVIDLAGNRVIDNGRPYYDGMVFRCDLDGGNFEVLGHNFRNNYEVAVDSFGTLWQSDNDDDGNRGTRINYVMEFGNYGYRDEMTGAGWSTPRTNLETEIPLRHWHLNDPGVVPNLLQTGAGSPAGICVYEGALLPDLFRNQIIHCDPGPSVVRSYPVEKSGAGYTAKIVNMLDGNRKNNWFRPVDPRVAPDGSLFVSDWYDPGVGGHAQGDVNRGRIFRVAPPGVRYVIPKFDFTTATGAVEPLKNPCSAVRYLAWTALHKMGNEAEPELLQVWQSDNPRHRARALWLLGNIPGRGQHYVNLAIKDDNPDLRIVGIRLARELKLDLIPIVQQLVHDQAPEVRRDCAIALRHSLAHEAAELWAELAAQHDGKDRWYLEALGIGADRQWDRYLDAWLGKVGFQATTTTAGSDVIWRSRAEKTPEYLARIIADPARTAAEWPRYFRAFDFQKGVAKEAVLTRLAFTATGPADRQGIIMVEALKRLRGLDLGKHPEQRAVVERVLDRVRGTATFIDLVAQLGLTDHYSDLLTLAQNHPEGQIGVTALRTLLERNQVKVIALGMEGPDSKAALATIQALATSADDRATPLLVPFVQDARHDVELRRQAVRALAKSRSGARALIGLARQNKLRGDLQAVAGSALSTTPFRGVKNEAAQLFPLPPAKDNRPLPSLTELARMRGDPARGQRVFSAVGTCANCHMVNGAGKDVGPGLSEIGKKLSRDAMLEAILYPSAAIDHNYETYVLELKNGGVQQGLKVSETAEGLTLKDAQAIIRTFPRAEIESITKSPISLMPADLAKELTAQDVADVVEYLLTLREAKGTSSTTRAQKSP
jgi:putative membrane-bound dehydrogenase-like protein